MNIFFPKRCVECNKEGNYICNKCSLFIGEIDDVGAGFPRPETSIFEYNGVIRKALKEVKYRRAKDILNELIERAFKIILNDRYRFNGLLAFLIVEKPVITYVPMFKKKQRYRGFNQSEIIAKKIGELFNLEVIELLEKNRETESQTKLDKEQRLENVKNAFVGAGFPRPENVLLVDDIFTTGATLNECKKILKKAGIKKIECFTLARTV